MARIITKELALKIVKKLGAVAVKSRSKAHDLYAVQHEGRLIAHLSIRRGSKKGLGHDYLPKDLSISPHQAKLLAECPWRKEDYLDALRRQGLLPDRG